MGTYAALESVGGQPVELYDFLLGATHYRYTSSDAAVTVPLSATHQYPDALAGTYLPAVLTRANIQATAEDTDGTLTVTLDRDSAVAQLFFFDRFLDGPLNLSVYRYHRAGTPSPDWPPLVTIFQGQVASYDTNADSVSLACTPIQQLVQRTIPTVLAQPLCNHVLFDAGCTLDIASFELAGTVAALSLDGLTVTCVAAATKADGWWTYGYVIGPAGHRVGIVNHVGQALTLLRHFPEGTIAGGDAITLVPGCDRLRDTCLNKFANLVNFLGFHAMPKEDPFKNPIV